MIPIPIPIPLVSTCIVSNKMDIEFSISCLPLQLLFAPFQIIADVHKDNIFKFLPENVNGILVIKRVEVQYKKSYTS